VTSNPETTFAEFYDRWRLGLYPREWRQGQALSNLLQQVRPDLAEGLTGSLDPFYFDTRIVAALSWIAETWNS
jgi:hypothetical protein